jgi:hypothetical protein
MQTMESNDSALKGTAATPELWGAVYMMLVFALLSRSLHAWERLAGKPVAWQDALEVAVDVLVCPAALWIGLSFQEMLKNELNRNNLSQRTYKLCNFWIARVLILAYIAIVL